MARRLDNTTEVCVRNELEPVRARFTQAVVEREFRLATTTRKWEAVRLRFGKPRMFPEGGSYYCVYRIDGLDELAQTRYAGGVDSLQALQLAMQMAVVDLVCSRAYGEGRLTWEGLFDLGLPVPEAVRARVRRDPEARSKRRARR